MNHSSRAMSLIQRQVLNQRSRPIRMPCDVFINHRGIDTKRTVTSLLYDHLSWLNLRPFLDNKNMKPGDKLFEKIDAAIRDCKVGVTVFSPRYCESYFCLHELALLMESKKKIVPLFCDIKPSELRVLDTGSIPEMGVKRFKAALEEAKFTVGVTFDSVNGNWSDAVTSVADMVIDSLMEVQEEEQLRRRSTGISFPDVAQASPIVKQY
ncbi:probable 2' cyclic ADP-D-ribose synthase BdTIR [Rhododendron vialii]|uniref:probable 2' cyclic ADP-D-ribose synthase BdTIR n=1 Tax=Rhododendron vialii TaxID=182163 RepID=UPI00265E0B05|nr:probable 2' cyclic ADP-D-ribose synthase BdTIR [Rhododendron vialii]